MGKNKYFPTQSFGMILGESHVVAENMRIDFWIRESVK